MEYGEMMSKEQTVMVKSYEGTWRAKWTTDGASLQGLPSALKLVT